MSKGMKTVFWGTMAMAILVMALLGSDLSRDWESAKALDQEVRESRARWEDTAERKEALQAELKGVTETLREAKLTIEESANRAEELEEEILQLRQEIETLREK